MIQILEKPAVREVATPITVEQYHRLSDAGIISERTELLRGVIVDKMSKSPLHFCIVKMLMTWLETAIPPGFYVRQEGPITLSDSEPEPDIAIVKGSLADHRLTHPTTAEMVIEVAIASLELDREKAAIYAAAGVPEYWIIIPDQQAIEVYTSPAADGYASIRRHDDVTVALAPMNFPELSLLPRELFS